MAPISWSHEGDGARLQARFDTYYRHDQLTDLLRGYAARYPELCRLYSLGQSPEGREFWMTEITGGGRHEAVAKPGFYVDGNTHAGEVTGSAMCLYLIHHLLTGYEGDEAIRRLVDTTVFYIRPRVSPDGAEVYLTTPHNLRSVPRPYPHPERQPGVHPEDMDGDGWITLMRIADEAGEWKVSDGDPRLMVPRGGADDAGGTYYRVFPEGRVHGVQNDVRVGALKAAPAYWGMDLNRNFPANWQPEHVQRGSGPYPLSEPETRVTADFILGHPNIGMIVSFHTAGHFVFRPPSSRPARDFPPFDIEVVYRVLGDQYEQLVRGPVRQSYDEKAGTARIGSLMDWGYQHLGIIGWVPEMWGWGKDYDGDGKIGELEYLRWNDEELGGEGFVDWHPYDHPQLGRVEIGGWKTKFTAQNPPGKLLEAELRPHYEWVLYLAGTLPRVAIDDVEVENLGDGFWRVTAEVGNRGLLPTNLTEQAARIGRARPVEVRLDARGMEVVHGSETQSIGHLAGSISRYGGAGARSMGQLLYGAGGGAPGESSCRATWILRGRAGGEVVVIASSEKAGGDRRTLRLQ